jgi:hypothetical protein
MGKRGPEPFTPNWDEFDKLCGFHCTLEEVASFFEVSEDTIERAVKRAHGVKFSEYREPKTKKKKVALRRVAWEKALAGDNTMIIWLMKQHMGMDQSPPPTTLILNNPYTKLSDKELLALTGGNNGAN